MKEELIDQMYLGLLEGQITRRKECEEATFVLKQNSVLKVTTHGKVAHVGSIYPKYQFSNKRRSCELIVINQ